MNKYLQQANPFRDAETSVILEGLTWVDWLTRGTYYTYLLRYSLVRNK